jgi:beta-glucosidase
LANDWWLQPLYHGRYPDGAWRCLDGAYPAVHDGDLETIAAKTDFLGLNIYSSLAVAEDWMAFLGFRTDAPPNRPTAGGMPLCPEILYDAVQRISQAYDTGKIYITENGAPGNEVPLADGTVPDPERLFFLESYLAAVDRCVKDGLPVKGYFYWSLLDNFEWMWGYSKRFGLVHVDFKNNLTRRPKQSFFYYQDWIKQHRVNV